MAKQGKYFWRTLDGGDSFLDTIDLAKFSFFKVSVNVFLNWAISVKVCNMGQGKWFPWGEGNLLAHRDNVLSLIISVP